MVSSHRLVKRIQQGFSLIELLLVLVIVTLVVLTSTSYMTRRTEATRIDKTVAQMQYILNAGMAYYVANGKWPDPENSYITLSSSASSELQPDFLPGTPIPTQYPEDPYYYIAHLTVDWYDVPPYTFQVIVYVGLTAKEQAIGKIIAGKLPNAHYDSTIGYVFAYVDVPGQNLNNATAVNFAGLYHHGACVPVPTCPVSGGGSSFPQIFVMPVSVSGVNDPNSNNIYPLSSFTAYSTAIGSVGSVPPACTGGTNDDCTPINGNPPASGQYWRVCLQVVTERGDVQLTRPSTSDKWGNNVTMAAFTRCGIFEEPSGSTFNVYTH